MPKTFLKVLAGIMALVVLAGIFYVIFFYDFTGNNAPPAGNTETSATVAPDGATTEETNQPVVNNEIRKTGNIDITKSEIGEESLKRIASSFAERFGSYSNHSGYSNVLDLKIFMTKSMQVWADNFVEEERAKEKYNAIYYGITTKAVSEEVKKFDDDTGQADILVKTQRRESTGEMGNASVSYQDVLISFSKENDSWKVNKAEWQK